VCKLLLIILLKNSLRFSHITTILKSLHWLKVNVLSTSFSLSLIKFLVPLSISKFLNWSLFSLLAVLDSRQLSPFSDHVAYFLISHNCKQFFSTCSTPSWNKLSILSVSLIHILVFHLLTALHTLGHHDHFHHQSFFYTPDLKHISASSLFYHRLLQWYSLGWSHGLPAGPFSLAYRFVLVLVLG